LQNWLLNKGDNAYLLNVIETPITNPDNSVFGFYLEMAKSKGSTKTGVFWINVCGIWDKYLGDNIKLT
jgi:hypothetical protein